jgi:CDP-diacylglycerol--glycerol-3-phosphate 3-phosphatidyltransferase
MSDGIARGPLIRHASAGAGNQALGATDAGGVIRKRLLHTGSQCWPGMPRAFPVRVHRLPRWAVDAILPYDTMASVADLLTISRLAIAPALPVAAALAPPPVTMGLIGWGLFSDAADGVVARRTGTQSERGARLDSLSDVIFYPCALIAFLIAYPEVRSLAVTWTLIGASQLVPSGYGWLKFGRLTSYHTALSRLVLVVLGVAFLVFITTGALWPVRVVGILAVVSALDDMLITALLPAWQANVPHAFSLLRRPEFRASPVDSAGH